MLLPILIACSAAIAIAQGGAEAEKKTGSILLKTLIKIKGPPEQVLAFKRKRFYLFRGGLAANKALVDRLKAKEYVSRGCYYCGLKPKPPSSEFIAWLKEGDCESPFCRAISDADIAKVPEFQAAYLKGNATWRQKPAVARDWLITNLLPKELRDGFYDERKAVIGGLLQGLPAPLASVMTDSISSQARFIDIELTAAKEKFLVSNLVPAEIGSKSYLFACEIDVTGEKVATLAFSIPAKSSCTLIIKDLPPCAAGACETR